MNLSLPLFDLPDDVPRPPQAGHGGALDAGPPLIPPLGPRLISAQPLDAVNRATRLSQLHPGLWRASQIGGAPGRTTASGFDVLDAQLPGGGWPHGVLTELLLPQPGVGELRLLAPALAAEGRCVMLFDPPAVLSAWALLQCGIDSRHWLVVQSRTGPGRVAAAGVPRSANRLAPLLASADLLWALEQALKSGHVSAILAWLPLNLGTDTLRRLQIAAQAHDGPVFVFRDALARSKPSPAPLRLLLQPAGVDGLSLRLLKRRGPPLAQALRLALPSPLTPRQQAQAQARELTRQVAASAQAAGRVAAGPDRSGSLPHPLSYPPSYPLSRQVGQADRHRG